MMMAGHKTTQWTLGTRRGDAFEDALLGVGEAGIAIYRQIWSLAAGTGWLFAISQFHEQRWWDFLMNRSVLSHHIAMAWRLNDQMDLARDLAKPAMNMPGSKLATIIALSTRAALQRLSLQMRLQKSFTERRSEWEAAGLSLDRPIAIESVRARETGQYLTVIKGTDIVI